MTVQGGKKSSSAEKQKVMQLPTNTHKDTANFGLALAVTHNVKVRKTQSALEFVEWETSNKDKLQTNNFAFSIPHSARSHTRSLAGRPIKNMSNGTPEASPR